MKKVLFLINNLGGGGAERVLIDILDSFDYKKYQVDLFIINYEGVYINQVNKNVRIKKLYSNKHFKNKWLEEIFSNAKNRIIKYFPKLLYRVFIKDNYDVEIAFLEGFPTTYLLSNSTNLHSKKIAWVHTDLAKSRSLSIEEEKKAYSHIDKIICVSKDCEKIVKDLYPNEKHKVSVIYNLINKDKIINKSEQEIEYVKSAPTIVSVGRLVELKRFDVLIRAHKLLLDDGIENKLIILGSGSNELELKQLIKDLNVENSVELLGFVSNPYPYIRMADIFAMSSDYEGFSLVVAEAIVLGKAIVSTRCVGPAELLDNGLYGILTNTGNEHELKDSLKILIKDESKREYYSKKSIERSVLFNKEHIINSIYDIIEN